MNMANVHRLIILSALLISFSGVVSSQSEMNETTNGFMPSVIVNDQVAMGDNMIANVTIAQVVSDGPGWIVIHNDLFGHPGGAIGYAQVDSGNNSNLTVTIHTLVATERLFAVLHYDRGELGVLEYPLIDTEQKAGDMMVIEPFNLGTTWDATLLNLTQRAKDEGICEG